MRINIIDRLKSLRKKALLKWKRINQNRGIKGKIVRSDKASVSMNEKKQIKQFWRKYDKRINYKFFQYYTGYTGIFDYRYVPDNIYYSSIDLHFNNELMSYGFDNKAYYDMLFESIEKPSIVIRKIEAFYLDSLFRKISFNEVKETVLPFKDTLILKPSIDSQGGKGIVFFKDMNDAEISKILEKENNYIVQSTIIQHPLLASIYPYSVNTIRIISLLFNNEVHILSGVLRMGKGGSVVDNASADGIVCGIDESGKLKKTAYSIKNREKYQTHPDSGVVFFEYKIPGYSQLIEIIKKQAVKFPHFKMISWDFAINKQGEPVFVEFNLKNGQLDFHQLCNGPLFKNMTEDVLDQVFNKK